MTAAKQLKLLEFAVGALWRRKGRNGAVLAVFILMVSLLFSVLFITDALKSEAEGLLSSSPDIVVQRVSAGRHDLIPASYGDKIRGEPGVAAVRPRVWGYYYDAFTKSNYTVMGAGAANAGALSGRAPATDEECALGPAVAAGKGVVLGDDVSFIDSNAMGVTFKVVGIFPEESRLVTNDLVILTDEGVAGFFAFPEGMATDIVVSVKNQAETEALARKIHRFYPDSRPITRKELLRTYDSVFNWRGGMLLASFLGAILAFCVLAWDKATGLSAEEKKEIGILKAIGWDTGDVLQMKCWEGVAIALTALLGGLLLSYLHVFFFDAAFIDPIMRGWSVLFPKLKLQPRIDFQAIARVFFSIAVPYLAATVIPAWRAAGEDPDDVIRG